MKKIIVGSLESSDCMITLSPNETSEIVIESIVYDAFYQQIENVIKKTLKKYDCENLHVLCQDKGALDYTIEARLKTAIMRYKEVYDES